jgi:hypothetical protein
VRTSTRRKLHLHVTTTLWLYQDFDNQEFETQQPKPLVTPLLEFPKWLNVKMGSDSFEISEPGVHDVVTPKSLLLCFLNPEMPKCQNGLNDSGSCYFLQMFSGLHDFTSQDSTSHDSWPLDHLGPEMPKSTRPWSTFSRFWNS